MQATADRRTAAGRLLFALALLQSAPAFGLSFSYNGFLNGVAGDPVGGDHTHYLGYSCPCYIGNYEYGAIYQDTGWSASRESLFGLQGTLQLLDPLSATVQIVARASTEKLTPDWAYFTYSPDSNWSFRAGRQRLPLYYYSDSTYIGYSYIWVRPPTDLYGWEVFDYDGGSLAYHRYVGDWYLDLGAYTGRRSVGGDLMEENVYYGYRVDEAWNKIIGGSIEMSNDIFDFRILLQHNKIDFWSYDYGPNEPAVQSAFRDPQDILGTAFTVDYGHFLLRTEANAFRRPTEDFDSFSDLVGVGYRIGHVTGMLTRSEYEERLTTADFDPQRTHTNTVTLRWDFKKSWDAKLQFDNLHDNSIYPFTGDADIVTVAVNAVF